MIKKILAVGLTAAFFLSAGGTALAASSSASKAVGTSHMQAASDFVIKNGVLTEYKGSGGDVVIPNTVTGIGELAFEGCTGLKSVTIPDSVTSIGANAFSGTSLTDIIIPDSVTSIDEYVFSGCVKLEEINVASGNTQYSSSDGMLYNKSKTILLVCPQGKKGKVMIPNTVTAISEDAFSNCRSLTSVTIPNSVRSIGEAAFYECGSLTSVTIPNSVTSIGDAAFFNCSSLTSVVIPNTVISIGAYMFEGCTSLKSVTIPDSVTNIGAYAFSWTSLTDIIIPDSVTSIGEHAFNCCSNLTSVSIPNSVTSISDSAFSNCDNLENINVAIGNTKYSSVDGVLYNKNKTVLLKCPQGKRGKVMIPNTVTDISEYAFYDCSGLTEVTIPASVKQIERCAFSDCRGLKTLNIYTLYPLVDKEAFYVYFDLGPDGDGFGGRRNTIETVNYAGSSADWETAGFPLIVGNTLNLNCLSVNITAQPKSQSVRLGEPVTFSVKASGSGLKYQWYFKKKGQTSFSEWKGRIGRTETVIPNSTWDGIQIYCKVTDSKGNSVASDKATVTLKPAIEITAQPKSQSVKLGELVTFTVKASGSGLKYQWYFKKKGQTSFSEWKGRIGRTETVTPNATWDGIQIYCKITDSKGNSVASDKATVTVKPAIEITAQPKSQSVKLGESVTFSVKASGSGLKYQWYFKKKGQKSFSEWKGRIGRTETVTPNATWNGIQIYCKITDSAGNTVNSATATVKIG